VDYCTLVLQYSSAIDLIKHACWCCFSVPQTAWAKGHYYANPSNRMWALLFRAGITDRLLRPEEDGTLPITAGIGFTDLGFGNAGTHSHLFTSQTLQLWRASLYERLLAHATRAAATVIAAAAGDTGDASETAAAAAAAFSRGCPKVVAFSGKRQWQELFFGTAGAKAQAASIQYGVQSIRPPGWPYPADVTQVIVLTSSSGASALTNEQREAPYKLLGTMLSSIEWSHSTA
jgi:thymine-DNA glycosylase